MAKVIFAIGVPGSGKTTALKDFADQYGYEYISSDDIRQELTGNAGNQNLMGLVWDTAYGRMQAALKNEKTVVMDATYTEPDKRQKILRLARLDGATKVYAVHFDTPIEIAKERNISRERVVPPHAMDEMQGNLDRLPPSIEEGCDMIFTLNEYQQLVSAEKMSADKENILHRDFGPGK